MVISTPSDENESRLLLNTCYQHVGPSSVRYPRGAGCGAAITADLQTVPVGKGVVRRQGRKVAILAFGTLLHNALPVAEALDLTVVDMRFVKPIDAELIDQLCATHEALVTLEDGCIMGGAGSAVLEHLSQQGHTMPSLVLGYPDEYIDHGEQKKLHALLGLDSAGIEQSVQQRFADLFES